MNPFAGTDGGEDADTGDRRGPRWTPPSIVRVDVDDVAELDVVGIERGSRLWIEVMRGFRVIGVIEGRLTGTRLDEETLDRIRLTCIDSRPEMIAIAESHLPRLSVIIPTICVEPDQLIRTVDSILANDYPNFELIVVDNRPVDAPSTVPQFHDERVRMVKEPWPGISAARNRGVAAATGDVVVFTDDDVSVDVGWLRALGSIFARHGEVEAAGGAVLPRELDTQAQLWFEEFYGGFTRSFEPQLLSKDLVGERDVLFPYDAGRFGAGCNMAFRRSTLDRLGGFDLSLGTGTPARGGEDLAMFIHVALSNGTLAFEPSALVRHSHRSSEEQFLRQVFGYGTGLTAMYTALIVRDPRQIIEIARRIVKGIRHLTAPVERRSGLSTPTYPRRARVLQLLGMLYGPLAYARSSLSTRRRARTC